MYILSSRFFTTWNSHNARYHYVIVIMDPVNGWIDLTANLFKMYLSYNLLLIDDVKQTFCILYCHLLMNPLQNINYIR